MPHEVFISHASQDKNIANDVCKCLESIDIHCWIAPRDIVPGVKFADGIIDGIEGSSLFLLILSEKSNDSPQVEREVERAVNKRLPILTVRIEDVKLSKSMEFFLSNHHWLDAINRSPNVYLNQLKDATKQLLRGAQRGPGPIGDGMSKLRSKKLLWIGLPTITLLGLLAFWASDLKPVPPASPPASMQKQQTSLKDEPTSPKLEHQGTGASQPAVQTPPPQPVPKEQSAPLPQSSPDSPAFQINYVYRPEGTGELRTITNGSTLHSGDLYKIIFTPTQNGYVYIYQADSAGQVFQLFPMSEFKGVKVNNENPVVRAKKYILPAPDKSFKLDSHTGEERIFLIVSKDPDPELEGLYRDLQTARQERNIKRSEETQGKLLKRFKRRGVDEVVSDSTMDVHWENSQDKFSILTNKLDNLSEDSVHLVEFTHK